MFSFFSSLLVEFTVGADGMWLKANVYESYGDGIVVGVEFPLSLPDLI